MKPVITYSGLVYCGIGQSARVLICIHPTNPAMNGRWANTSVVLSITPTPMKDFAGPMFETANSIYRPAEEP